jgi:hypothetical protein
MGKRMNAKSEASRRQSCKRSAITAVQLLNGACKEIETRWKSYSLVCGTISPAE